MSPTGVCQQKDMTEAMTSGKESRSRACVHLHAHRISGPGPEAVASQMVLTQTASGSDASAVANTLPHLDTDTLRSEPQLTRAASQGEGEEWPRQWGAGTHRRAVPGRKGAHREGPAAIVCNASPVAVEVAARWAGRSHRALGIGGGAWGRGRGAWGRQRGGWGTWGR